MLQTLFVSLRSAWDGNEVMGVEEGKACRAGKWTRGAPSVLLVALPPTMWRPRLCAHRDKA